MCLLGTQLLWIQCSHRRSPCRGIGIWSALCVRYSHSLSQLHSNQMVPQLPSGSVAMSQYAHTDYGVALKLVARWIFEKTGSEMLGFTEGSQEGTVGDSWLNGRMRCQEFGGAAERRVTIPNRTIRSGFLQCLPHVLLSGRNQQIAGTGGKC